MKGRITLFALVAVGTVVAAAARAELRPAVDRPDVIEVGTPVLIDHQTLALEMRYNADLREWVAWYGEPEYAEVQEIQFEPPFAPYEVRLYYVKRNAYLAFGRVRVAPNVYDYGVRRFIGPINAAELDRLLTAQPAPASQLPPAAEVAAAEALAPVAGLTVETTPVEGVPVD